MLMMKRIIGGLTYNTETATEVARWGSGGSTNDFRYFDEGLYLTKKGRWFLAGHGGAITHYAESAGNNSWTGGCGLSPLTNQEAMENLERHGKIEALETYFADQIQEA